MRKKLCKICSKIIKKGQPHCKECSDTLVAEYNAGIDHDKLKQYLLTLVKL